MTADSLIKLEYILNYQLLHYTQQKEYCISDFTFLLRKYVNRYD